MPGFRTKAGKSQEEDQVDMRKVRPKGSKLSKRGRSSNRQIVDSVRKVADTVGSPRTRLKLSGKVKILDIPHAGQPYLKEQDPENLPDIFDEILGTKGQDSRSD